MQFSEDGSLKLSPTDLADYLACNHLTSLELGYARGEIDKPTVDNAQGELIRRKGDEHEQAYLDELKRLGKSVLELPRDADFAANASVTEQAIRDARHDVVYQACLAPDGWRGYADFLGRQADGSYEAVDTKLGGTRSRRLYCSSASTRRSSRASRGARRTGCTSCSAPAHTRASGSPTSTPTTGACGSASSTSSRATP